MKGQASSQVLQCGPEIQNGENGAEPGQRSGSQSVSTRIAAQILELTLQGTERMDTGFRGPEPVVSPEEVEWESSVPQADFITMAGA